MYHIDVKDGCDITLLSTMLCGEHRGEVWKVEFNITGTTLVSAGDDGMVMMWQKQYKTVS